MTELTGTQRMNGSSKINPPTTMNNPTIHTSLNRRLTDVFGLQKSGIFPAGKEPCLRTLRIWTQLRRIPSRKIGHFVYYDLEEVAEHIHTKLKIPARG